MMDNAETLLREYCRTRAPALRNELVEGHLDLAYAVARRFAGRGVEYDDLCQVAAMALMKATERYDLERGVKFTSFVIPSMVGEVKNFFRDRSRLIRLPRRSNDLIHAIEHAKSELMQKLQRSPTAEELAREMNIPIEDILETIETQNAITAPASLDSVLHEEEDDYNLHGVLGVDDQGYSDVEIKDMMEKSLSHLSEMERRVLYARYYQEQSQREVARLLNTSQMTVSRVERRAIKRLADMIKQD